MTLHMRKLGTVAVLCVLCPEGLFPQEPQREVRDPTLLETTDRFTLHSSPWINLHHFLFQWARSETEPAEGDTRRPVEVTEKGELEGLPEEERRYWSAAVEHYRGRVSRDLTFNEGLIRLKAVLLTMDEEKAAASSDETIVHLVRTMPIYRSHWWERHDRANREWIRDVASRLRSFEGPLGDRVAAAWSGTWPHGRIRLDVSSYANWAGAYTTNNPSHVVLSSREEAGWEGFESVFHESSHTSPLDGDHQEAVRAAFQSLGKQEPDRFWHALIFYTAGELTRQLLESQGVEGFRGYADKGGFYERASWAGYRSAFDTHWRAYLDGELDRETALRRIAEAISR